MSDGINDSYTHTEPTPVAEQGDLIVRMVGAWRNCDGGHKESICKGVEQERDLAQRELQSCREQLIMAHEEMDALNAELARIKAERSTEIQQHEKDIEELRTKYEALKAENAELERGNVQFEANFSKRESHWVRENARLETENADLRTRNTELKALVEWVPITPENMPSINDEIGRRHEHGFWQVSSGLWFREFESYRADGWTHYRPINAPPPVKEPSK